VAGPGVLQDASSTPRQKVAARLTKIEKSILQGCLNEVATAHHAWVS